MIYTNFELNCIFLVLVIFCSFSLVTALATRLKSRKNQKFRKKKCSPKFFRNNNFLNHKISVKDCNFKRVGFLQAFHLKCILFLPKLPRDVCATTFNTIIYIGLLGTISGQNKQPHTDTNGVDVIITVVRLG